MISEYQEESSLSDSPRCAQCGEVIGVYEPYILVTADAPAVSSRAADPLESERRTVYHLNCYEQR